MLSRMTEPGALSLAALPKAGDVVGGKYALERLLGQGGMGAVYAARHLKLGHAVAVKVMLADAANHEAAARFINEGRAAANIQNEHVVRVFDVDEEQGYAYMILELLEGEDLGQIVDRQGRLPSHVAVGYVLQALQGVRQAHAQGIVHRDLKPSNLFLARRQDGSTVVKVLDFGISKANQAAQVLGQVPGQLTSTKAMLGSPLYMSPEQLRSSKSVDARADIWAMGIILFELVTASLPYGGDSLGELFAAILENDAPSVRSRVPDVPAGLDAVITRCLQRKPDHRFADVAELERELRPFAAPTGVLAGTAALDPAQAHAARMQLAAQASQSSPGHAPPPGHVQSSPNHGPSSPAHASNPQVAAGRPYPPAYGQTTGSGANVPVVKRTEPLGAVTPQPGYPSGGQISVATAPKSPAPIALLLGIVGVLVLVGGVGLAFALRGKTPKVTPQTVASAPVDPPASASALASTATLPTTPSASASPTSSAAPTGQTAAVDTAAAAASAPASPRVGAGGGARPHNPAHGTPQAKVDPPKADPPKVVTPPTPPTKPTVATPATGNKPVQQDSR